MKNTILAKRDTAFEYALPSRLPVLFEAAAEFTALPGTGKLTVNARAEKDIHYMTYFLKPDNALPFKSAIIPRHNPGFTSSVKINGKAVKANTPVVIPPKADIRITYKSTVFRDPAGIFVRFPYLSTKNFPIMRIILPDNPNEAEKFAAERILEYFKFTGEKGITGRSSVGFSKKSELKNGDIILNMPFVLKYVKDENGNDYNGYLQTSKVIDWDFVFDNVIRIETLNSIYELERVDEDEVNYESKS